METLSHSPPLTISRYGRISKPILVGIVTLLLQLPSSKATSVGSGSVKAELFHREHPFSRLYQRKAPSHAEKQGTDGGRSGEGYGFLVKRRLSDEFTDMPSTGSFTWETNVTDAAPYEYLMSISLGTPPQTFVAVADTGSDLTWLQCQPCESCFSQPSPFFNPTLSSTYQNLSCSSVGCSSFNFPDGTSAVTSCTPSCEYYYYYDDLSNTTGTFSSEAITLESTTGHIIVVPDFWFGCSHAASSTSGLYDSSDGIVGLGQGPISLSSQLGHIFEDKFSYCLVNRSLARVQSSPLVFGDDAAANLALQYTPILYNEGLYYQEYYYIGLEGISVGGVPLNFDATALAINASSGNGGMFIDSGTTITYLNPVAYEPLLTAINATLIPKSYEIVTPSPVSDLYGLDLCYNVSGTPDYKKDLPEIYLKLANNTSWDLDVENAWLQSAESSIICLTILAASEGGVSILGNSQQRDFHVLYDRAENRIGFAKTDCGAV